MLQWAVFCVLQENMSLGGMTLYRNRRFHASNSSTGEEFFEKEYSAVIHVGNGGLVLGITRRMILILKKNQGTDVVGKLGQKSRKQCFLIRLNRSEQVCVGQCVSFGFFLPKSVGFSQLSLY